MIGDQIVATASLATLIAAPVIAYLLGLVARPEPFFIRDLDDIPDGGLIVDGGELR